MRVFSQLLPLIRGLFLSGLFLSGMLSGCGGEERNESPQRQDIDGERAAQFFGTNFPSFPNPQDTDSGVGPNADGGQSNESAGGDPVQGVPIFCRGVSALIVDTPEEDLFIDGSGRTPCIRIERDCAASIRAKSITLNNCRVCVEVRRRGSLLVEALNGSITCTSTGDGVRANTAGNLVMSTPADISLIAADRDHGIRVTRDSSVRLEAGGACRVEGGRGAVHLNDNGIIDLKGCAQVAALTPTETTPDPPTDTPAENDDRSPPVALDQPIHCRSGTLLLDVPQEDLVIDGRGRDRCIRIERGCNAELRARNVTLTNCRVCAEVSRGASLRLEAAEGNISCNSVRDGVVASSGAAVSLRAAIEISILSTAESSRYQGIQATQEAQIELASPVCRVGAEGGGDSFLAETDSRISTDFCENLVPSL